MADTDISLIITSNHAYRKLGRVLDAKPTKPKQRILPILDVL